MKLVYDLGSYNMLDNIRHIEIDDLFTEGLDTIIFFFKYFLKTTAMKINYDIGSYCFRESAHQVNENVLFIADFPVGSSNNFTLSLRHTL